MLNVSRSRSIGLYALFVFSVNLSFSQFWEVGGLVGASNYNGDLARKVVLGETNLSIGAYGKYNFTEYFSWKFGLNYAKVSGGDYNFKEYRQRNLSFHSHIVELDNRIEFNFVRFGTGVLAKRASPFFFAGLNAFYFNPKAEYNGTTFELRPLGTEGQTLDGKRKYLPV
ncbi:MAG: DUF6089 family protein, partial [Bacteroidota bacterium]|nr:DUF6089 family protein [Bacteroidota bacterium]MDX5468918.1 DUF6089 family protein [Bacteroidota bacterium]